MLNEQLLSQLRTIFWGSFVLGVITFFCPFIENHLRWEVYWKIFEDLFIRNKGLENGEKGLVFILISLIATFFWSPMMGYAFYKYSLQKQKHIIGQKLINYFLFIVGVMIYLLPVYIFIEAKSELSAFSWGYWLLLVCTTAMFICYIRIQKEQLMDKLDISQHLINDEK